MYFVHKLMKYMLLQISTFSILYKKFMYNFYNNKKNIFHLEKLETSIILKLNFIIIIIIYYYNHIK